MKNLLFSLLVFFMFTNFSIFSQSIIWEKEFVMGEPTVGAKYYLAIDSDSNIVLVTHQSAYEQLSSYFIKLDQAGELLSFKQLYNDGNLLMPHAFYETDKGYRVLMGTADRIYTSPDGFANTFPMIFNLDKNGDTINTILPYDYNNVSIRCDYSFGAGYLLPTTIVYNKKFYNVSAIDHKKPVQTGSKDSIWFRNAIFNCFDENGLLSVRRELDTFVYLISTVNIYALGNNPDGTFYTLIGNGSFYLDNKPTEILIFEIDSLGNTLKKLTLNFDHKFIPRQFAKLKNGNYVIYHDTTFMVINEEGTILKEIPFEQKNEGYAFSTLKETSTSDLILTGTLWLTKDPTPDNIRIKLCILILDKDFNIKFEYEWYEHIYLYSSSIINLILLDDNTIIVAGPKDRNKFWIAKMSLKPVSVGDHQDNPNFYISPYPASDYIEIRLSDDIKSDAVILSEAKNLKIYNTLGECVLVEQTPPSVQLPSVYRFDISVLSPGLYFISIYNGNEILTGSFIVLR